MNQSPATLENILADAVEIVSPAERQAFVERACAGDAVLRARAERLIEVHFCAGSFLGRPAAFLETAALPAQGEILGAQIGPYKLLEQIGEGGMGVVFVAEQLQPIRRTVALKLIKPGMDSKQVVARFSAERQALALMDHPNIAKVLDAGATDAGRPYFVMELVRGIPITEYCDQARLTIRQRLAVFVQVCRAVQHAHTKGVIHRDLKPSNVLVTSNDGVPVPVVIDFGVAKALGQQLTERTLHTGFAQMIGTPLYMSPEQATFNQQGVDTRSDVYSLGVMLYELLTGVTPFDRERLRTVDDDEFRRILREEEPARPSVRLSTLGKTLSTASERRGVDPRKLTQTLHGELDWIVLKALEKDRTRRYETASAFAADVERYLNDEQVEACPPSALYRLRKFARRNRARLVVAVVLGFALLAAAGSFGWATSDRAARQSAVVLRVNDALDESERAYKAGKVMEALTAAKRAESLLAAVPGDDRLTDRVRDRVLDLETVQKLDENFIDVFGSQDWEKDISAQQAEFERLFLICGIDLSGQTVEEAAGRIRGRLIAVDLAAGLDRWAHTYLWTEQGWRHPVLRKLIAVARQADPDPWRDQVRQTVERIDIEAIEELARTAPIDELPTATLRVIGQALYFRYPIGTHAAPAREFLRRAQRRHPDDAWLNGLLASALCWHTPYLYEEGAGYLRVALALNPHSPRLYQLLGKVMEQNGKAEEAVSCFREALRLNPHWAVANSEIGHVLMDEGQPDEALVFFRKAIELDPKLADAYEGLSSACESKGLFDEAIAFRRKAVELDPHLGWVLEDKGRFADATEAYRTAIELNPRNVFVLSTFAVMLTTCPDLKFRNYDKALGMAQKALKLDAKDANAWVALGIAHYRRGEFKDAVTSLGKAMELSQRTCCSPFYLAMSHQQLGAKDEARAAFRLGVERMEKLKRDEAALLSVRAEAAALLGLSDDDPKQPTK